MQGILELNACFLVSGLGLLWGLHGWRSWLELVDTLGLALLLGVGSVGVLATLVLVAGAGLPLATVLGLCAAVTAVGAALGLARRRPLPTNLGVRPRLSPGTVAAVCVAVATVAILVAFFRVARVTPLGGGDSWEFWVPKAKVIYFFGGIDNPLFTSLTGYSYPLFVPALQAMDFRAMGSAFAPALAVQYWLLYAGFVFAAAAVLRRRVPSWLAWLFVGLTAVVPELDGRLLGAQADWTLDILFALAALLAVVWLRERETWLLVAFGVLLAAVFVTKREGQMFAACLVAGVLLATVRDRRRSWPPFLGMAVLAYVPDIPWRFWWMSRDLPSANPGGGVHELVTHLGRFWPSLVLVLRLLFAYGMWLALVPIAIGAAAAALTLGGHAREAAVVYLVTSVTGVAGLTAVLWAFPTMVLDERQSSTPIPRAVGALVLLSAVLAPLLIEPLLRPTRPGSRASTP